MSDLGSRQKKLDEDRFCQFCKCIDYAVTPPKKEQQDMNSQTDLQQMLPTSDRLLKREIMLLPNETME